MKELAALRELKMVSKLRYAFFLFTGGYYIYLEASGIDPGHSGYLISGLMQRSLSGICTVCCFIHHFLHPL